ncbi:MAG TPA: heparinase II/III family protein, partial [Gemmatimonadaceae bacterium]
ILEGYVERYASYPNVDNVLGPTRLFFSTYLESIWLLQICIAADLLGPAGRPLFERVRERIIEPSRALIAEFNEGRSNRQVWNAAALLAAARVLDDPGGAEEAVAGRSGIISHLTTGLLADGTWYEGENYHLFAHRGLWYGVTLAEEAGFRIAPGLIDRFQRGFATPFATALPDFTLPSRRDSQYAISLRQWRIAEHTELGVARRADAALLGALERIYRDDIPRQETGRAASSADVERNAPPSALTRADLSWRALLRALPHLPPLEPDAPRSVLLEHQGLAVFRRNQGRTYVALDYGQSGGGHGHPDRLGLLLVDGQTRWLDDPGTGSYVDPSLHWYRSTLAHNAPLVGGKSQRPTDGTLESYDERDVAGWIDASAVIAEGARVERTIVVMEQYVVDRLSWTVGEGQTVDVPIHADVMLERGADAPIEDTLVGGDGLEDGFRFVHDTTRQHVRGGTTAEGLVQGGGHSLRLWAKSDRDAEWWRGVAPGPPGSPEHAFRIVRASGSGLTMLLAWSAEVSAVEIGADIKVSLADKTTHVHTRDEAGWHIELHAGNAHSSIDLGGRVRPETASIRTQHEMAPRVPIVLRQGAKLDFDLGERHYRRSEQSWVAAGRPTARVTLAPSGEALRVSVHVPESDLNFVAADAVNPYDNEHPDINGDGVQLFVRTEDGLSGWTLVPRDESNDVRIRAVDAWNTLLPINATWQREGRGYTMAIELGKFPTALDVVVNESPRGRVRRRGQLLMSGAEGEFVYLRGDRHEPSRLIPIRVVDE